MWGKIIEVPDHKFVIASALLFEVLNPFGLLNAWEFFGVESPYLDRGFGLIKDIDHHENSENIIRVSDNVCKYWDEIYDIFVNKFEIDPIHFYICALTKIDDVAIMKWLNTTKYKNVDQKLEVKICKVVAGLLHTNTHDSNLIAVARCSFCRIRRRSVVFLDSSRLFYCEKCLNDKSMLVYGKYIILNILNNNDYGDDVAYSYDECEYDDDEYIYEYE